MKSLPWGLTLEEVNRIYQEKFQAHKTLREDASVFEIELQIQPHKIHTIPRGVLKAIEEVSKGAGASSVGRLFGYLWEGKFFGRVVLYKNQPGQSRNTNHPATESPVSGRPAFP